MYQVSMFSMRGNHLAMDSDAAVIWDLVSDFDGDVNLGVDVDFNLDLGMDSDLGFVKSELGCGRYQEEQRQMVE